MHHVREKVYKKRYQFQVTWIFAKNIWKLVVPLACYDFLHEVELVVFAAGLLKPPMLPANYLALARVCD